MLTNGRAGRRRLKAPCRGGGGVNGPAEARGARGLPGRGRPGGNGAQADLLLGQVRRRGIRVPARGAAQGPGPAGAPHPPPLRDRVAEPGGAAEPGLGALHGARARAPHPALPPPTAQETGEVK